MTPVLSAQNVSRRVAGAWLWRDLSFEVFGGNSVGVVGRSGTGKTLLLRALVGLDPLEDGTIRYQDKPLSQWAIPTFRRDVVYLPQKAVPLAERVRDDLKIAFGFGVRRAQSFQEAQLHDFLKQLGKPSQFLDRPTRTLSGGELQVLALVRALQLSPKVLLLDEPTAALDETSAQQYETVLQTWCQMEPDHALVLVSHSSDQVGRLTDRVIELGSPP